MKRIGARIEKGLKRSRLTPSLHEGAVTKLVVREDRVQIVVEVTPVLRGCAYKPEIRRSHPDQRPRGEIELSTAARQSR